MRVLSFFLSLLMLASLAAGQTKESGKTESLMDAVEEGNLKKLQELLQKDGNPDVVDRNQGVTPLILACMLGRVEMVDALISAKADLELPDASNRATPLMWASIQDHGKAAREKGIPVPSVETKTLIVRKLLQAGARPNARDNWGGTALLWAAEEGNAAIVKMLILAGADVNPSDSDGLIPLMAAVNLDTPGHVESARLLIASKASIHAINKNGDTALFYAINNFLTENVKQLLFSGANVNHRNHQGFTPLMRAAQLARIEIMKVLIEKGAELTAQNSEGLTALEVAERAGFQEAIDILVRARARKSNGSSCQRRLSDEETKD